jgi:hypothetical protein
MRERRLFEQPTRPNHIADGTDEWLTASYNYPKSLAST